MKIPHLALFFISLTTSAYAANLPHTTTLTYTGFVNSQAIAATGYATYSDDNPSNIYNEILFSSLPSGYDPRLSMTIINTLYCPGTKPPRVCSLRNLGEATGGNFTLYRDIQALDSLGNNLGLVKITATVNTTSQFTSSANVVFSGDYSGTTAITGASGYAQILNQSAPNTIEGEFTQQLGTALGDLYLKVNSRWEYTSGPGLDNEQLSILNLSDTSYDSTTKLFTLHGSGYYACPGPLPVLGAGVAFNYSRKIRRRLRSVTTYTLS